MDATSSNVYGDDGFSEAFAELKVAAEEAIAGRASLSITHYEGPGGVHVVCQEAFHHNFDLSHEHWAEVVAPKDEVALGGDVFRRPGTSESLAFVHLLLTGDKAAGKTTFLNGLTTGALRILQCLRYESGLFYNIWYAPSASDLIALRGSLAKRALPFFQTELAHGGMVMDAAELRLFLEDEEFDEGSGIAPATQVVLDSSRHVLVKLLELGGDCLHELLTLTSSNTPQHPVKIALLRQSAAAVRVAAKAAYFVNLTSLFAFPSSREGGDGSNIDNSADAVGPVALLDRLRFLRELLREDAEVLIFCTQAPDIGKDEALSRLSQALSIQLFDFPKVDLVDECGAFVLMVECIAEHAGIASQRLKVFNAEHLDSFSGETNHTAVLQSLRRLLGGDCLNTPTSALVLLAEQVAHLLFDKSITVIDKDYLAELLEDFDDDGYAELYRKVLHPMVVVPPMVLLDSFNEITELLATRGLLCLADGNGQLPLDVEITAEGFVRMRPHLQHCMSDAVEAVDAHVDGVSLGQGISAASGQMSLVDSSTTAGAKRQGETETAQNKFMCFRVLAQQEVKIEARRILNLFQVEGCRVIVPAGAAESILVKACSTVEATWAAMPSAEAFSELYLASRFLLLTGHEPFANNDSSFSLQWDAQSCNSESDVGASSGHHGGCIAIRLPHEIRAQNSWLPSVGKKPMMLHPCRPERAPNAKRLRVDMS